MAFLSEAEVETTLLEQLASLGYASASDEVIGPDGGAPERDSHDVVILQKRLEDAVLRLNPHLPQEARADAVRQMKEAKQISGQRILIYQTDNFLKYAQERYSQAASESAIEEASKNAIEEIRAVSASRSEFEVAVKLQEQFVTENTNNKNSGIMRVELRRPVRNFTVRGYLNPGMIQIPSLDARLISAPDFLQKYKITVGSGATYNFNIHIISGEPGAYLPVGIYELEYTATCEMPDSEI